MDSDVIMLEFNGWTLRLLGRGSLKRVNVEVQT